MKNSNLNTFLKGQNKLIKTGHCSGYALKGSAQLDEVCGIQNGNSFFWDNDNLWFIDVLDDGTAISYCKD